MDKAWDTATSVNKDASVVSFSWEEDGKLPMVSLNLYA